MSGTCLSFSYDKLENDIAMKFASLALLIIQIASTIVAAPAPSPNPGVLEHAGNIVRESTLMMYDGVAGTYNAGKTVANLVGSTITGSTRFATNTFSGIGKLARNSVGLAVTGAGHGVALTGSGLNLVGNGIVGSARLVNDLSVQQVRDAAVNGVTGAARMGGNAVKTVAEGAGNLAKTAVGSTLTGVGQGLGYTGGALNSLGDRVNRTGETVNNLTGEQLINAAYNGINDTYKTGQNAVNGASNLVRNVVGGAVEGAGNGVGVAGQYLQSIGSNMSRTGSAISSSPESLTDSLRGQTVY